MLSHFIFHFKTSWDCCFKRQISFKSLHAFDGLIAEVVDVVVVYDDDDDD